MAYNEIPSEDITVGKPTKKSIFQKIRDNFIDHESRISALSAGANKISVFEYNIDPKDLDIGRIVSADMTLTEFQEIHGTGWIIADGSSCSGSIYAAITGHSVVPDLRDEFLRGASGSVTLGTSYSDSTAVNGLSGSTNSTGSHTHTYESHVSSSNTNKTLPALSSTGTAAYATVVKNARTSSSNGSHSHTVSISGDSETRPQNFGVNFFIKINLSAFDNVVRIKAKEAMTIVNVKGYITDTAGLPTSGNFEIDIQKGSTVATLSSIYSVKPTLAYSGGIADGDATSSGTILSGGYTVASGDWLQLDIKSLMVGQSGVYIQVFAEPA